MNILEQILKGAQRAVERTPPPEDIIIEDGVGKLIRDGKVYGYISLQTLKELLDEKAT